MDKKRGWVRRVGVSAHYIKMLMSCYVKDEQLKMLASKSSSLSLVPTFYLDFVTLKILAYRNFVIQLAIDKTV